MPNTIIDIIEDTMNIPPSISIDNSELEIYDDDKPTKNIDPIKIAARQAERIDIAIITGLDRISVLTGRTEPIIEELGKEPPIRKFKLVWYPRHELNMRATD